MSLFCRLPSVAIVPAQQSLSDMMDAILYMASSGCQWRMLSKDFSPLSKLQHYFYHWQNSGLLSAINHSLVMAARELEGKEASPTTGVIDSKSVKTTESGGIRSYDAGKKVKGRKGHIITDTLGCMLVILVHSACIQDRDGVIDVIKAIRYRGRVRDSKETPRY